MNESCTILSLAVNKAAEAHEGQFRKGTKIPYVTHPFRVMTLLLQSGVTEKNILSAALLHDVLEDTEVEPVEIFDEFGEEILDYTLFLTENKKKSWEERKCFALDSIWDMSIGAKWIKLADCMDNMKMMIEEMKDTGLDWNKFKKGSSYQRWYYLRTLHELAKDKRLDANMISNCKKLCEHIFGYYDNLIPDMPVPIIEKDEETIFVGEGETINGYIYRCEGWLKYGAVHMTYFMDSKAVESCEKDYLINFLELMDLVEFHTEEKYVTGELIKDFSGQELVSINVVLEDAKNKYASGRYLVGYDPRDAYIV